MSNFDKQLEEAIKTYSNITGESVADVKAKCSDFDSQTSKNIQLLMFAAR